MSKSKKMMDELNPKAFYAVEDGIECFIEDVVDPDNRIFRVEYQTRDGGKTVSAFCRYNPWGMNHYSYTESHLAPDGHLCLSKGPLNLHDAVLRARYWCVAFSYLMEKGKFPQA